MNPVISEVGPVIISPSHDIDHYSAWRLREEIGIALGVDARGLIVSLEDVPFMDSTGLGVLVGGWKRARDLGVPFHVVCSQERIHKMFRITGLNEVMLLHASVSEALAAVAGGLGWGMGAGTATSEATDPIVISSGSDCSQARGSHDQVQSGGAKA